MPYDRLVRCDLLESDRWLDLHTDAARLFFIAMLLHADDFGNLEGGTRLMRIATAVTQVKDRANFAKLMSELQDADLARRYEVDGKELWHLPRFRNTRTYWRRVCPPSPWCDAAAYTGPHKGQRVRVKSESDLNQTSIRSDSNLKSGVGVGVGVGVKPKAVGTAGTSNRGTRLPADWQPSPSDIAWAKQTRPDLKLEDTVERFRDYWLAQPGQRGVKVRWDCTWRTWVRNEKRASTQEQSGPPWWSTEKGIVAKGKEVGLAARPGESWQEFKGRIQEKLND